jgi:predicted nucleotidyltransferase
MARLGIDRDGIQDFLTRLSERCPVEEAWLFGSRSRNEELSDSDYDLLLVSRGFERMAPWDRIAACLEFWTMPEPLEVVPLTPAEFAVRKDDLTIVGEAVRTGFVLAART